MKQIIQNFKTGETTLLDLPTPKKSQGKVLIKTRISLVSIGTERMLVEFGKANIFEKARAQPEKVKQVIRKVKKEGLIETAKTVFNKLDQPIPLGYCNVGEVIGIGKGVSNFSIGDRVVSNGPHAEIVNIPENLVANIPNNVSDEEASFTIIGSIGLHGIRLINPTFGETIVVIGLGIIGIMVCQLLKANGCHVIGLDLIDEKRELAEKLGIKVMDPINDPISFVKNKTNNIGADGVLITASTKSNKLISESAKMCRKRGRIILIGVVGLDIDRSDFYKKEISFQVSCSYGPGRYDSKYEQEGIDYPISYVRWTEKRNFEAILSAISDKRIQVKNLITQKEKLRDYHKIYNNLDSKKLMGSILTYSLEKSKLNETYININNNRYHSKKGVIGIIGAGNFTKMTLLPAIKNKISLIKYLASESGFNSTHLAKKYGIKVSTTDYKNILNDPEVDIVIITTRHDSHSGIVIDSLKAGKNVFVEKPLTINESQLKKVIDIYNKSKKTSLMVGFNRRFSPHAIAIKESLGKVHGAVNIVATMNAGSISKDHWVNNINIGGGRIIGEACHMIDLCVFLSGSLVKSICANHLENVTDLESDNVSIMLKFTNGSNASINYFSNGSKNYGKEKLELFYDEQTWLMNDFKETTYFGSKKFKNLKTRLDKGHNNQFKKYIKSIKDGSNFLIPINEIINVTRASFCVLTSLKEKKWVEV